MFSNAVKLVSISGFDIKIDPSWLIIAALIAWSLSQHYFPSDFPDQSGATYLTMAIAATLLFFASLLLHELAHAVVARRFGLPIGGITLFLFGGVAEMEAEPKSPKVEFLVAVAGPVMSVSLSLGFLFLSWVAAFVGGLVVIVKVLSYLAIINLVLAAFNLIPAFPLDGGRIFRAYLWYRYQNLLRATKFATQSGMIFAFALMGLGVLALFQGFLVSALWQILIGGFLLAAARSSYQAQLVKVVFAKKSVSDLMQKDPITVHPDVMLSTFVDQVLLLRGLSFVPVVDDGVLLGHIDKTTLAGIDRENWTNTKVGDVFAGLDTGATVAPDMPVEELLKEIAKRRQRKFLVVRENELVGVVSLSDVARHMELSDLVQAA